MSFMGDSLSGLLLLLLDVFKLNLLGNRLLLGGVPRLFKCPSTSSVSMGSIAATNTEAGLAFCLLEFSRGCRLRTSWGELELALEFLDEEVFFEDTSNLKFLGNE